MLLVCMLVPEFQAQHHDVSFPFINVTTTAIPSNDTTMITMGAIMSATVNHQLQDTTATGWDHFRHFGLQANNVQSVRKSRCHDAPKTDVLFAGCAFCAVNYGTECESKNER